MAQVQTTNIYTWFRILVSVCVFRIVVCQDWVVEDEGCRTPDRGVGDCIAIKQCKPMVDFLSNSQKPLSQAVISRLNAYTCGYEGKAVKVCCPSSPIFIENPTNPVRPPVTPAPVNQSPPDVSNHRNFDLLPKECGYIDIDNKIINGKNALLNEFPWMALLSYSTKKGPQFRCGGTILNDRYILTAAHCISDLKDPLLGVRVGEHNIQTRTDCEVQQSGKTKCADPVQDLAIEEILTHPAYNATVISNDIGLLRVSKMNLSVENARPVCLPTDTSRDAKFNTVVVTGWGVTGTGQNSLILQKVGIPVMSLEECQNVYKSDPRAKITYRQVCAGGRDNKDSCPGDSGGPLHVPAHLYDSTRYVQHGIVSFGPRFCGLEGFPGVYTRVAYYMDWVLDAIKP